MDQEERIASIAMNFQYLSGALEGYLSANRLREDPEEDRLKVRLIVRPAKMTDMSLSIGIHSTSSRVVHPSGSVLRCS